MRALVLDEKTPAPGGPAWSGLGSDALRVIDDRCGYRLARRRALRTRRRSAALDLRRLASLGFSYRRFRRMSAMMPAR
jgi:hypothetical protein